MVLRATVLRAAATLAAVAVSLSGPLAQDAKKTLPRADQEAIAVAVPVFGQLVAYTLPKGFRTVHEGTSGASFAREAVLRGQSTGAWTQMISVTGFKGGAGDKALNPQKYAERIANQFKQGCSSGYLAKPLGASKIEGQDAFATIVTCSTAKSASGDRSETAVILAIKGRADYYTIQWAERGTAAKQAPPIDEATWTERLKLIGPVRVCPIVEGEAAPYASCLKS